MTQDYSSLQAWFYDRLVGTRTLNLHDYILKHDTLGKLLAEHQAWHLLDVGCGGGQAAIRLKARYPHIAVTGVDLSAGQITRARQRAHRLGYAVRFEVGNAQSLPFPDASFDVVYSLGSAKHWPDPRQGFAECWRVLRPGGELLVADNTSDATHEEVQNFYDVAGFPRLLRCPLVPIMHRRLVNPCRTVEEYRSIATELNFPAGTVSKLVSMPVFLFRTRKPMQSFAVPDLERQDMGTGSLQ